MSSAGRPSFSELMQPRFSIHVPEKIQVRLSKEKKNHQNFHQSTKKQNKTKSINMCRRLQRTKTMLAISVYSSDNNNIFFSTENRFFGMVLISRFDNIMHPVTVLSLRTGST